MSKDSKKKDRKISVVVCTYNGESRIVDTLISLVNQKFPHGAYEILVVDNNSSDDTSALVNSFIGMHSERCIKYFLEKTQGLSCARNRGIKESKGEIIAFIDDDAVADHLWLKSICDGYNSDKSAACVGGKTELKWNNGMPQWWYPALNYLYSGFDYGEERCTLHYPHLPVGTNISFLRSEFEKVGLFKNDLGRKGGALSGGEETDICMRIEKIGGKILYEPRAIVYHNVDSYRQRKSYIFRRAVSQGRSLAILEQNHFGSASIIQRFTFLRRKPFSSSPKAIDNKYTNPFVRLAKEPGFRLYIIRAIFFGFGFILEILNGKVRKISLNRIHRKSVK